MAVWTINNAVEQLKQRTWKILWNARTTPWRKYLTTARDDLTTVDRCYFWHFVFWENHSLIDICFNICMDWSCLDKAILENRTDQGLIFTFKAEIKHYYYIDRLTNIIDHHTYMCFGHSAQNRSYKQYCKMHDTLSAFFLFPPNNTL